MLRSKKGSAIIIVLIISIIAMSLTLFAIDISKKIVQSSEMLMDKLHAKIGVESEIEKLKFYASTGNFHSSYMTNTFTTILPEKLYLDGRAQKIDNNTILRIKDSGGFINIWSPSKRFIEALLKNDNISASKIAIILNSLDDWYDDNNLRELNGAEKNYYRLKGYSYSPRNSNGAQSIYEWRIIRGFDNKTFDYLKSYLILSPHWNPNINTMPAPLLSAIFNIPVSVAKTLENIRLKKGSITRNDLRSVLGTDIDTAEYGAFPTFVLDINAEYRFNKSMEKVSCVISFRTDNSTPYRVLKWLN